MARIARVTAPEFSHHINKRGNHRQKTFFNDEDYQAYMDLISEWVLPDVRFRFFQHPDFSRFSDLIISN
jgi:hypothetical protein